MLTMGPDPKLVSFAIKSALAACLVMTILCLLLTAGTSPAAGSAGLGRGTDSLPIELAASNQQNARDQEGDDPCPLSRTYPANIRQWCEPIRHFADQHDLSPELVAALILQESGGDPLAYSSSGAVGLMQVMPRDGLAASFHCVNGPCFASRPTIAELQDPEFNIDYGTRMLSGLLARTGDLRAALKAYGPMDVGYAYADAVLTIYENYR